MKTIIHVNQHIIKSNQKGGAEPPLTVKTYKDNRKASQVIIRDATGAEVARVVYRPEKPLACGARVWVETHLTVEIES